MREKLLVTGEPAPWFVVRSTNSPQFIFSSVGGRYTILCFFQSAARDDSRRILADFWETRARFDDENLCFFGVSTDPADERDQRVTQHLPGVRFFWDFDEAVSRLYGAVVAGQTPVGPPSAADYRAHTVLLDPLMRVVGVLPFDDAPETHVARVLQAVDRLPPVGQPVPAVNQAPVLVLPRIFESGLCQALIEYYEAHGGEDSGFMREKDGITVHVTDYAHKRRRDRHIQDETLRRACMSRIHDRLAPMVELAYQFHATRIERYVVACYDASDGGHFRPHRDNTTKGTAHRRFAVSLHLNTGAYEGGHLRFPEFGPQLYSAPAGGAVVFSCSLLHEAMPVTRGRRYMFLPFLYDEPAAKIREQNLAFVEEQSRAANG
jgi:predicted 2-oxoglutarate/Fe(II)-dependent dioxygenase YbiX